MESPTAAGIAAIDMLLSGTITWNETRAIHRATRLSSVLKGVLNPGIATLAPDAGVNNLIVSTHITLPQ